MRTPLNALLVSLQNGGGVPEGQPQRMATRAPGASPKRADQSSSLAISQINPFEKVLGNVG